MLGNDPSYEYTKESFIAYARKIKADFLILTQASNANTSVQPRSLFESAMLMKLELGKFLTDYSRVLYLDADILVSPHADNIFDIYPDTDRLYLYNEAINSDRTGELSLMRKFLTEDTNQSYWNVGVLLLSRGCGFIREIELESLYYFYQNSKFFEQTYINLWIRQHNIKVEDLNNKFNYMANSGTKEARFSASFIHYAGHGFCKKSFRPVLIRQDYFHMFSLKSKLIENLNFLGRYCSFRLSRLVNKIVSRFFRG
ncbi:MAG: hypothetical protein EB101_08705 [Chitinophagia bacterium]|jgi:lipopolysaccharide biosynthesis glycosyltransferase|nr:hypothetical protein [Chitinophagia bacterium]